MAPHFAKINAPPLKAIISAGEQLSDNIRKATERIFNAPVFNVYATIDVGFIGQECEAHEGLHINQEFFHVEIVDSGGVPLKPNCEGRVIVTPLDPQGFPLIRYDIGDLGTFLPGACPCGRTLPRIILQGRAVDVLPTPTGILSPHIFRVIFEKLDPSLEKVFRYQLVQDRPNHITLLVVPAVKFTTEDQEKIKREYERIMGNTISLDIQVVDKIEAVGGKIPLFIPYRKRSD